MSASRTDRDRAGQFQHRRQVSPRRCGSSCRSQQCLAQWLLRLLLTSTAIRTATIRATSSSAMRSSSESPRCGPRACAGTVTAIRGIPCIDINYTDPRVLAGNFTPRREGVPVRRRHGQHDLQAGYVRGLVWRRHRSSCPAGALKFALGAQWRRDFDPRCSGRSRSIRISRTTLWQSTSAGITAGHENTKEAFGEIEIPLLRNVPGAQNLTLNGAARVTSVEAVRCRRSEPSRTMATGPTRSPATIRR